MERRRKILVTRPQADAGRTAAGLAALGFEPVLAPMLEMHPRAADLPDPSGFTALAVTSANAVRALAAYPQAQGFFPLPLFAVGEHTANEARATGFQTVSAAGGTLHGLAETLTAAAPSGPVFYPAPHDRSGDLAGLLAPAGIAVETRVLYEMRPATGFPRGVLEALMGGEIAAASFYSRRTATIFSGLLTGVDFAPVRTRLSCLCLSENVARPLLDAHFLRIGLADYPSEEAMMALALTFLRDQISP